MAASVSSGDSEDLRLVDRIRVMTFKEARDAGASFITQSWVANRVKRSIRFVKEHWNGNPYEAKMNVAPVGIGGRQFSDASKELVQHHAGKQKRSVRLMAKLIEEERGKTRNYRTVHRELQRMGFKPFHVVAKPMKSQITVENRLWFADFLRDWDEEDFFHVAPSDEFYVYSIRRPNHQNDRVWARSVKDIEEDERYRNLPLKPSCVGIFICFTARAMIWVVKDQGQSWDGVYFRDVILTQHVFPFLKNPENVLSVKDVCFLHDKAPAFKALATQDLMRQNGIDFFDNSQWPGSSPDLNPTENLGAILKERVEKKLRAGHNNLARVLEDELTELSSDVPLFRALLASFPRRIQAVREAQGGHTDY